MFTIGSIGRHRVARAVQALSVVVLVATGLTYPEVVASASPSTAFEITDANIADNPAVAAPDWASLFNADGSPKTVAGIDATSFSADLMSADALPSPPCDAGKKGDLTVFGGAGGEKNGEAFTSWTYQSGSSPPSSDDLTNVYAASAKDASHTIFYFGGERSNTNGDSHIDFEFTRQSVGLQQDVKNGALQTDSSGCPEGHFTGARSVGDLLISVEYSNGGGVGTAQVRVWDGDSYEQPLKPKVNPTDPDVIWTFADMVAANVLNITTNAATIDCGPWNCRDSSGASTDTLAPHAFIEGYVDVSHILPVVGCFSGFNTKTRSSDSWSSTLKDFALGSFNTCDANISITPSGVNAAGSNHTFTATVNTNDSGTYGPKSGVTVTGTTSFGSFVGGVNTCTTNASGQCTLTITSSTSGTSTVNVSATVPLASGASVFRSTATAPGPGGSGPATKNWVDAYVKVTPDDVNPINQSHEFTVEYGVLGGGAAGLSVATPTITPTITPAPATAPVSTCATPTKVAGQNVWTCTVTINSAVTGVYVATASASTTVTMAGGTPSTATLARSTTASTHGTGGNNGATKTYVDARISITPSGLNEVGHAHTITATVEQKIGNADWATVPAGTTVTFALGAGSAGVFVDGHNTCVTNASGQCSVQINSPSSGTSTVSASTDYTTSTTPAVTMTRSSNTITKQWVDGAIAIVQTATNEVSHEHVFTITATPIKPAAVDVTNVAITPSVAPSGATTSTTCSGNVAVDAGTGKATCTFTINSATPGIFAVDAAATFGYSWSTFTQNVDRSTLGNSGPGGNDGASKTFVDARVSLGNDGVNKVGDAHTVTGFAEQNAGSGWTAAVGKTITFTETSDTAASSFVGGVSTCVTGADGKCTVQINSLTPGVTWIGAGTSYAVGGVTLTRASATTATDPANLRKEWVDAHISITPDAVNEVGHAHVFNIVVTATAASAPIVIATPTSSVSPVPNTTNSLSCAATVTTAGVGATRSCTLTINSTTAGVFTANASATVTIGGTEVFNLTTNSQAGNSGPAVKTFVDASLSITPNGVNEVGHAHTVTATVKQNNGTDGFVVAAGKTVTFTETGPGDIPASCVTAADGTCSVQLTSTATGVSSVHAAVTLSVLGQSLTRETGTAINTAAGGSGDLTKRWIDGAISITPNDVNPVGAEHTFTVTATAIASGAGTPSFAITPTVSPAPSSQSTTCGTPTISNGGLTATCTVTINSNVTGVFTANASVTITIAGVQVVRNTDPSDQITAGTGGSGPATKRYVDANIQITPSGINQVGDPHVVTGHVNVDNGSGTTANAPAGTVITFTVQSGPGTLSSPTCATVGTTGSCTVTLSSDTVGTTDLRGSASVTINGVTLDIVTNGAGTNSGDVRKDWVDGLIKVTPNDVNAVNDPHTFNVEYTVLAPAGTTVTLGSLTADVTPNPNLQETTCAPVRSGNTWTCSVVINSSVTGVFHIDASGSATVTDAAIPLASKVVARSTTGTTGPGGNTGATKTYVDARISVTPGGLNEVDHPHTVTATVETKDGNGDWVKAPAGTTVTFARDGAGSFDGPGTCLTIGTTGACSIKITSPVAGTTTVGGSATVTVHGVSITRATGTAVNTAAGGSGPITKEWVDGSIRVVQTATNEVNHEHVFTITAEAHLPGEQPDETVHFDSITPSVVDPAGALTTSSDCATPVVTGASATCTFTINSATAGVFDVDATAVMSIDNADFDPVVLTRSTTGDSGPAGNTGATKTFVDATVEVGPDGVNAVGDPHTVVGTARKNPGTGWVPAVGETITFAITSGPGVLSGGGSTATCVAGAEGTCSVVLTSLTAGTTWVSASTSYAVGGVTLHRTTAVDGATDPDNLRKEWVRANLSITGTAVNTVNQPHTFTVVVDAQSSGALINIAQVLAHTDHPTDVSNVVCLNQTATFGSVTRTCTLTINRSAPGIFVASADVDVNIGGVLFHLATNGQGGNSGPAVKTYVDARISLANDGVNAVGDPHPVTATVEVNDGTGWTPAPAGVTVELTETGPGSIPATCTTAGTAGTCTVNLTSTTAGVSTVHGKVTVNELGQVITRETSTPLNTAAGGSGDLTKRWVDGFVTITPDAVNEVGHAHTFNVTATIIPSGATGDPTFVVTPAVTPAPGSMSTTCASPVVSGNTATCTVTINSQSVGAFAANVTAKMSVAGVTITRSTDPAVAVAGPGGSGQATKRYVDAFITIAESAVNPVNKPHTFTITTTAIPGAATPVVFSSITTTVAPAPGTMSSTCASPVVSSNGNVATCTLTINSSVAGSFLANATAHLTIGGAALVRSTDSTVAVAGPGGSGPATKRYEEPLQVLGEVITPPPAPPAAVAPAAPALPHTGADVLGPVALALLLIVGGLATVFLTRRRRRGEVS